MNTPQKPRELSDHLAVVVRRRKPLIATLTAGIIVTILLAVLLPPHYQSAGTVLIEQQEMPTNLVQSTVTSFADERVQIISQRVMTTETLLDIIARYGLYPRERARDTREELLAQMRKDIGLKMISADVIDPRDGRPTSATIAFQVSYTSRSPDLAAKVANELVTLYLNENLTNRTQIAAQATDFLRSEGDRINKQIADLEARIEKFRQQNYQRLPGLTEVNMQLLDRDEQQLLEAQGKQNSLEEQRVFLEAQLAQLKPDSAIFSDTGERILSTRDRLKMLRSQLAQARARYAPDYPDVVTLQREVAGLEREVGDTPSITSDLQRELQEAQSQLADARKRYAPDYPDRVRLEREVASLQAQLATSTQTDSGHGAAPATGAATTGGTAIADGAAADGTELAPTDADNPAYVQIRAQLSATLADLKAQADEIAKLRAEADGYQRDLTLAPAVAKQYDDLTREYDNAQTQYQEIRAKQLQARTAQDLESNREGERFTLIDPPLTPEEPVSPNRKLILAAGSILSAALAAGVLWLLERFDTTIRTRGDLLQLIGVPPLALVPYIGTEWERAAARRRLRIAAGSAVASFCMVLLLIHLFYRPLDVLWFSLARRMGF